MESLKIISILLVLSVTLLAGAYPFFKKKTTPHQLQFPIGESLAAGVFLGAGLIHMLGDAMQQFYSLHVDYPLACLLTGTTFLFFLLLEHIAREVYHQKHNQNQFTVIAVLMLSVHSFLAGIALGSAESIAVTFILLLAILAHKWAASFSLAVQINKTSFSMRSNLLLFMIFTCMLPLGIVAGNYTAHDIQHFRLMTPIFLSLAAGTFLYLGTLHGLDRAVMIKQCCNLKGFFYVIIGFSIMGLVAIWT